MQMFGVGVLELMVILLLAVIVVGPDKLPQVAADLGRWIRQTRAYARHLMGDFNEVVSELQKEAGASSDDWKEIANVVTRHTGSVGKELTRFTRDVEKSGDIEEVKRDLEPAAARNGDTVKTNGVTANSADGSDAESPESAGEDEIPEEEKPWYVPETAPRRRSSD